MIMITAILYGFFLVHVIVCTTVNGSERDQLNNAGNQSKASLSRESNTYQNNTNKECVLTVNETDLIFLQQLVRSKVVHVVELDLQFPSETSNSVIKEWRWNLTNNVGREILSVLAMKGMRVTWTLDVGRKTTKVKVVDKPPGCATTRQKAGDFIAGAILKQLSFVDEKEMCFDKVSYKATQTRCCKINGKDLLNYQCYVSEGGSEFVKILELILSAIYNVYMFSGGLVLFTYFGIILQWRNTNNTVRRQGYYKLTECPMSISSILCMLFWDGYGRFISFVRRCLLILVVFLVLWRLKFFSRVFIIVLFSFWALFYPFSRLFYLKESEDVRNWPGPRCFLKLFSYLGYDIHDVYLAARINVSGSISLITLPFNVKRWKKSLLRFCHKFIVPSTMGSSLKDKVLSFVKTCIFCLFYILFIFIMQVILVLHFISLDSVLVYILPLISALKRYYNGRISCIAIVIFFYECACFTVTSVLVFNILIFTADIVIPLVSGLFLNIVYFFPYIVYISTLTFYSWMFWASVEEQYAVLMTLIFDQNIKNSSNSDSSYNNDNNTMNNGGNSESVGAADVNQENVELLSMVDHVGHDSETRENNVVDIDSYTLTEIVCVVSQELYDKIRGHLLPYHGNLFRFVLKVFGISLFSYLTLTLVRILQASNISSTVQALVTFSVCALPYIMNVVAAGKSEQGKEMWKEQLKHRVKPLVDEFTANDAEMSRTKLNIRHALFHLHEEKADEEMRGEKCIQTSCETISGQIYR